MTDLTIRVKAPGPAAGTPTGAPAKASTKNWTLSCGPPEGSHPDPAGACAALAKTPDPFAPVPENQQCTMIFGGPEEATVTGTWKGKRVDAKFSRKNGCEIARWNGLAPVFGQAAQPG